MGFLCKNTGVVCHSLLQWAMFCQNSPLWLLCFGWPYMTWLIASLSFTSSLSMYSYSFSSSHVEMWELDKEGWVLKNWFFQAGVLEKTLERHLDCKEIKPVNPEGNHTEYSLEGVILKLKLQYFGHMMQRADSFERTLILGKIEGGRRRGWQRMTCWMAPSTQWTWVWVNSGSWWWTGRPGVLQSVGSQRVGHDWATELNWTDVCYVS